MRVRYSAARKSWTLYWRHRDLGFYLYDQQPPSQKNRRPAGRDRPRPHVHLLRLGVGLAGGSSAAVRPAAFPPVEGLAVG
ncbi:MAG: DUF3024 domain-containing protein [Kribbellaceae bacterium]|nr:DUF3024 domain-containing protein [Catenulispora sp.]NUR96176.1 DUF3024 domain-containing protein [Kribbellaceae bacterium]